MIRRARRLAIFVLAASSALLIGLELRLFWLQVLHTKEPADCLAYRAHEVKEVRERGPIVDRRGGVLACTLTQYDVYAWADDVRDKRALAQELARSVGANPETVAHQLRTASWPRLASDVLDPTMVQDLKRLRTQAPYRAVWLEPDSRRFYPRGSLFAPLLGFVNHEHVGVCGLEQLVDEELLPAEGVRVVRRDNRQTELMDPDLSERPARPGATVHLTLDPLVQELAETAVQDVLDEFGGNWAQAIVMDPRTAELLAVAQRPAPARSGRPESGKELKDVAAQCMATQQMYAPGSTFKPLMLALAMEHGLVHPDELIPCDHGRHYFGRRRIRDILGGHGELTPAQILVKSSNIGIAKIVLRLVDETAGRADPQFVPILEYLTGLGFGQVALGMPGEQTGLVPPLRRFTRNYTLVSLAMGHEIAVTAVQMAAAAAVLANGGIWQKPRLIRGRQTAADWWPAPRVTRPVLSSATVETIREMLGRVIEEGSAARHRPRGYSVGGKTGTPEKEKDRSKISPTFFGFAPLHDPKLLVLMVVDEPTKGRYASEIIAPTALTLLGNTLRTLDVPPDRPHELDGSPTPSAPLARR